jgi:predicted DNA-binding ribbon-helix-helix protein
VHLEDAFWVALKEIAAVQGTPVGQLIAAIDSERRERQHNNLSSVIRLFVLEYYRSRVRGRRANKERPAKDGEPSLEYGKPIAPRLIASLGKP